MPTPALIVTTVREERSGNGGNRHLIPEIATTVGIPIETLIGMILRTEGGNTMTREVIVENCDGLKKIEETVMIGIGIGDPSTGITITMITTPVAREAEIVGTRTDTGTTVIIEATTIDTMVIETVR